MLRHVSRVSQDPRDPGDQLFFSFLLRSLLNRLTQTDKLYSALRAAPHAIQKTYQPFFVAILFSLPYSAIVRGSALFFVHKYRTVCWDDLSVSATVSPPSRIIKGAATSRPGTPVALLVAKFEKRAHVRPRNRYVEGGEGSELHGLAQGQVIQMIDEVYGNEESSAKKAEAEG